MLFGPYRHDKESVKRSLHWGRGTARSNLSISHVMMQRMQPEGAGNGCNPNGCNPEDPGSGPQAM